MKPDLTSHELTEIAMCLRLGAAQSRKFAEEATSLPVKENHVQSAEFRARLAERVQKMAKG
jgi:hypothetical protein